MRLQAHNVRLAYDTRVIAEDLSLTVPDGKVSVLIGPNGCGKSTALRALARLLPPDQCRWFAPSVLLRAWPQG